VRRLTPPQFSTLIRLAERGKCAQNQLGRLASMDVAAIKGVVDRLRQKGFVTVEKDPNDKRRALITLTPEAAAMISDMTAAGHLITEETLAPLTEAEKRNLVRLLKKIS
jgi:DNA-binding MarR family transcriptional regulator